MRDHHPGKVSLALLLIAGCAEMGPPDDEDALNAPVLATVADVDFNGYSLGSLGAPWSVTPTGSVPSKASIVTASGHGRALLLHGSTVSGDFLIASLGLSSSSQEISAQVALNPAPGAAFVWALNGAGSSIGRRRVRLQRAPGSSALVASTAPSGNTTCGVLPSGSWTTVTLRVHAAADTFDVLMDGASTACTGIATGLGPPFNAVSIMDASNEGWGGDVQLDDIQVTSN